MNNLLGTLGLGNVDANPSELPDGRYDGVVKSSEYVLSKNKDALLHINTYKVCDGDYAGREKSHIFQLGRSPRDADGNFPDKASDVVTYTPTMTDDNKSWYKKMWIDILGKDAEPKIDAGEVTPADLVGAPITFGVKRRDSFVNVNFVERRDNGESGPVALAEAMGATATSDAPADLSQML